jgi:Leucine-rich repeat (LRR) protein
MPSKDSALLRPQLAAAALPDLEEKILGQKVDPAAATVLDKFKQKNVVISNFGNESSYLMANFVNVKNYDASLIEELKAIAPQLLRVRLSKQPVLDEDLKTLSACKNITSLNLEQTQISNEGLKYLASFPNLEQLNLYGTKISDQGLIALAKCPQLKSIYLWQTQVTETGIAKLQKALPHAKIERGGFLFPKPDTSKAKTK